MDNNDTFDKDVEESRKEIEKVGLAAGGMGIIDEGGFYDVVWQKFKTKNWFIILVPRTLDDARIPEKIEFTFYPPNTPKNAGFEITYVWDHFTTIMFCHKKYMNHKQLEATLFQQIKPSITIPRNKDVISLKGYTEPETLYWINKVDQEWDNMQNKANELHRPESMMVEIETKNPRVINEVRVYQGLRSLHENILDYVYKKAAGE